MCWPPSGNTNNNKVEGQPSRQTNLTVVHHKLMNATFATRPPHSTNTRNTRPCVQGRLHDQVDFRCVWMCLGSCARSPPRMALGHRAWTQNRPQTRTRRTQKAKQAPTRRADNPSMRWKLLGPESLLVTTANGANIYVLYEYIRFIRSALGEILGAPPTTRDLGYHRGACMTTLSFVASGCVLGHVPVRRPAWPSVQPSRMDPGWAPNTHATHSKSHPSTHEVCKPKYEMEVAGPESRGLVLLVRARQQMGPRPGLHPNAHASRRSAISCDTGMKQQHKPLGRGTGSWVPLDPKK
jgi:hypothetical protein